MIKPVNGHLLIEPIAHESFMASQRETYEEIGIVVDIAQDLMAMREDYVPGADGAFKATRVVVPVEKGSKIYFDSWLAAKYPKADGKDGEFYWLVKWEDVRAIEDAK